MKWKIDQIKPVWFLMFTAAALVLSTMNTSGQPEMSDRGITAAIETELQFDNAVTANAIDVVTDEGVVTLSGTVRSIRNKERAAELASVIVGVRSIINRIEVDPPVRPSDRALAGRIQTLLKRDPVAEAYEVAVEVDDGNVTLSGIVDSFQEKALTGDLVRGVDGVIHVENNIQVNVKTQRSDDEIRAEVERLLQNEVRIDDGLIEVSVTNGTVTLSGSVGSLHEKNLAYALAWIAGTESVVTNALDTTWLARETYRREDAVIHREDDDIRDSIQAALFKDPRVLSARVDVHVATGIATLSGTVDNLRAKTAAEEDARFTPGVWRVVNHIKVRTPSPLDVNTLEKRIVETLKSDSLIDDEAIEVSVDDTGWVTLKGTVNTSYEKHQADLAVRTVVGVLGVRNQLAYEHPWNWRPDPDLKDAVEEQLFWSALVDGDDISVAVEAGVVTLTGTVTSQSEKQVAEKNAYQGGAKHVENRLKIDRAELPGPMGPYFYHPMYPTFYWW